jgi:hypothetical protein
MNAALHSGNHFYKYSEAFQKRFDVINEVFRNELENAGTIPIKRDEAGFRATAKVERTLAEAM